MGSSLILMELDSFEEGLSFLHHVLVFDRNHLVKINGVSLICGLLVAMIVKSYGTRAKWF